MSQYSLTASDTQPSNSRFIHFFGDILSEGVNIGEAHSHPNGTIDVLVDAIPSGKKATLIALGECKPKYSIVRETSSAGSPGVEKIGDAKTENQTILLDFSNVSDTANPSLIRLLEP
jgi:hypothetical protein